MTSSVGRINFGVGVDAESIKADLIAALTPALVDAQADLKRNPLNVDIKANDIDTATAIAAAQKNLDKKKLAVGLKANFTTTGLTTEIRNALKELAREKDFRVDVKGKFDTTGLASEIKLALREMSAAFDFKVKIKGEFSTTGLSGEIQTALNNLPGDLKVKVKMTPDFSRFPGEVLRGLREIQRLFDFRMDIPIGLDSAAAIAQAQALRSRLSDIFGTPIDQSVRLDVDRGLLGRVNDLRHGFESIGKSALAVAAVGTAIAGITGAVGAAAGAVGGLAVGLLALGPAASAIGATVAVGVQGLGDAFSAMNAMSTNAGTEAASQAKAVASAQSSLSSANDAAADSAENLAEAQADQIDAAEDLATAYAKAEREVASYGDTVRETQLDEADAADRLTEARERLAKESDPAKRAKAARDVERAEIAARQARQETIDVEEQARKFEAEGVEATDTVIAAKERKEAADKRVADAAEASTRATENVAKATAALAAAQTAASPSATKFQEALAKLAPEAQKLVLAAQAAKPAFDQFGDAVQNTLLADLGNQFTLTANEVLPRLQEGMTGVAGELNGMAVGALEFFRSAQGMQLLNASFASGENLLRGLRSGTGEFSQGILDLTTAAAPAMFGIGEAIAGIGSSIGTALSDANASGGLTRLFAGLETMLTGIGPLVNGLLDGLISIGEKVLPALGPLFETLGGVLEKIGPSLGDIGAIFAESLTAILPSLGNLIVAFADGLAPILPVVVDLIKVLAAAITPLIGPISDIAVTVGNALAGALESLLPALQPIAEAFASLVTAIAPLVPFIADAVSVLVQALAPALTTIFKALGPVIEMLVAEFSPILEDLGPILSEVATVIAQALVTAIEQLAPLLPELIGAFLELVRAVIPILPELARLAAEILPPLVDILIAITPILLKWIELWTWLVDGVISKIVIPAIELMTEKWSDAGDRIHSVVTWLTETVFPPLGDALEKVKGWFSGAVTWIGEKWGELRDAVATPVNFVIDTVWNNGLLKAWGAVDNMLGGILPDQTPLPLIPKRAKGGAINYTHGGSGNGTKDDILTWLSNDEHVWTAFEKTMAGGHNIVMAMRDMVARGIPFTWNGPGQLMSALGAGNLEAYGAAVSVKGIGNVPPEGLFDPLAKVPIPRFAQGGPVIMPWMTQLKAGHDFAKAQNGRPYKWAGPQFTGDSFDCSGLMGSIIAAILGDNPWQRYWATPSFAGYPAVGPQGLRRNLLDGAGMIVGITDDPGGPGGGHTAGELRAIPELGIPAARVESGGALGNVHYGRGTDPLSFASLYGLGIGANGFFQPSPGGGSAIGPSTDEQRSVITKVIERMLHAVTDPIRETMVSAIGLPPPQLRALPPAILDVTETKAIEFLSSRVGDLGDLLGGAWQKAQDIGGRVLDFVNPFDSGGVAVGRGFMPKNVIAPERVLNPTETQLFETLIASLSQIAAGGVTAATVPVVELAQDSITAIGKAIGLDIPDGSAGPLASTFMDGTGQTISETGEVLSDTQSLLQRTETSLERTNEERHKQVMSVLSQLVDQLTETVLLPMFTAAIGAALKEAGASDAFNVLGQKIGQVAGDIVARSISIAAASSGAAGAFAAGGVLPGYTPGRDVHRFYSATAGSLALSGGESIMVPQWTRAVGGPRAVARMNRAARGFAQGGVLSFADGGTLDTLGGDLLAIQGPLGGVANVIVKAILQVAGIELEVLDTLQGVAKEVRDFRGDAVAAYDDQGQILSDTSAFIERTDTNSDTAQNERDRVMREILKGVLKFLITTILVPVISAILSSLITLATTAIGTAIAGPVGTVIGAAVGAGLSGIATIITASIGAILAGGIDAVFDSGGLATGVGFMPKNILAPERVLDPGTTRDFGRLVDALTRPTNRTVQVGSMTISGPNAAGQTADSLLGLLNT